MTHYDYRLGPGWAITNAYLASLDHLGLDEADLWSFEPPRLSEGVDKFISFDPKTLVWKFTVDWLPLRAYIQPEPPRCLRPTPWSLTGVKGWTKE